MASADAADNAGEQHVVKKSVWSKEEDRVLRQQVLLYGPQNWRTISLALPGRSSKSCSLRWRQHLAPDVEAVKALIAGRTDNAIKNRWNSVLREHEQQSPTPPCLLLFPLASGDVKWNGKGAAPGWPQVASGEDVGGDEGGVAMECLELMPLAPGDVRDNASAAASKGVDCGAGDPLTEPRLAPVAAAVSDAMPPQAVLV